MFELDAPAARIDRPRLVPPRHWFLWFLVGALVGSPAFGARGYAAARRGDSPDITQAAIADRRLLNPSNDLGRAIARVKIWTPSDPIPQRAWTGQSQGPPAQPLRFDIPPGTLATVIPVFENLTGLHVTLSEDGIRMIASPGVSGVRSAAEALTALLTGTGVAYRMTSPSEIVLFVRVASETVEVSGAAPRVPSPKFSEPIRDTPQTITIVPQAVIEAQGATSLRDVLRNVPGITYQAGEGGGGLPGDSLTMRGFSASNDIFIDGVRDAGGYSRDAFNLEQVEIVKGPASTYAGRGTTGGSINLTTKTPGVGAARAITFGGGSSEYRRGTLDVNQPIGGLGAGSAVRLNAMWTDAGVPGRNVVENQSWAIAPSFAAGLTGRTRLTASYLHLEQDNVPDYGLPWAAFEASPSVPQDNFYGLKNYDYENIDNDVATVQLAHQVTPTLSLRNLARYGRTMRDSAITAPRPPNRQLQQRTMTNETLADQLTMTGDFRIGLSRHSFVTGVEFIREDTRNRNGSQTTNQPQIDLYTPDPNQQPFGPLPPNPGNPSEAVTGTIGAYAFDTVHLSPQIQLTGGLRWDRSEVDYELRNLATGSSTVLARTDRMVSWRAGAVYKPRPEASFYAAAGTSFNPSADAAATGTALSDSPTAANNVNLEPEKTRNYEVGTKWDVLGSRLSLAAAVFRTEKTNARTRNLTNEPFVLSGRQRVDGVELSASGSLTRRWSVLGGYAWMQSDIVASANPAEESNNLALVPKSSLSLWTNYQFPWRITAGAGVQFVDNVFRNTLNTLAVPSYWLVNGMASYEVNRHLTLRLNGTNLGDEQYVDRVGGGHYIPGPRRAVALTTDVKF
jgi:catecholate siderophore receptor